MWRIRLALLWAFMTAVRGCSDLCRSGFSGRAWGASFRIVFVSSVDILFFACTGEYPSKYGGVFVFTGTEQDRANLERMGRDCPPEEALAAYALGQSEISKTERIKRGLICAHVIECDGCTYLCQLIRQVKPDPPEAPIIAFR